MRVIVSGASGFIGSHVIKALHHRGHNAIAVFRDADSLSTSTHLHGTEKAIVCDLLATSCPLDRIAECDADVFVHLAWCTTPPKYLSDTRNLAYAYSTQQLARALGVGRIRRLVSFGTCAEYDWEFGYLAETTPLRPRSLYAASKAATYQVLVQLARDMDLHFTWVRPFFQYGPGEHPDRLVASMINSLLNDAPVSVKNPQLMRDYLFVEDVASAIVAIVESPVVGPINIGLGKPIAIGELVRVAARQLGREHLVDFSSAGADCEPFPLVCANTRKLMNETGWRPSFSLEEGMSRTVSWWERQRTGARI